MAQDGVTARGGRLEAIPSRQQVKTITEIAAVFAVFPSSFRSEMYLDQRYILLYTQLLKRAHRIAHKSAFQQSFPLSLPR